MTIAVRGTSSATAAATYSTGNPAATLPAGTATGDGIFIFVGTKPDTAGPASATGYTNIDAFTGGTGSTGIDTGPTRIGVLFRESDGTDGGATVSVTVPSNNVSWAFAVVLSKDAAKAWGVATIGGDDSTGASAAYSATSTSNPGVTAGDYVMAACVIPTDACTVAVGGALTNNLTQTGSTFGTATASGNLETASGQDLGGHVRGVPVSSGTGSANLVYTVTFTGSTNTYGPTAFVRAREVAATLTRTVDDARGLTDSGTSIQVSAATTDDRGLTDSLTTALFTQHARTVDDARGLADSLAQVLNAGRQLDDPRGLTDSFTTTASYARTFDDSRSLTDTVSPAVSYSVTINDGRGLSDSTSSALTSGDRVLDDGRGLTDQLTAAADYQRTFDDGRGLTDAGQTIARTAETTDSRGLTDSITAQVTSGGTTHTRTLDDSRGLTDVGDPMAIDVAETVDDQRGLTDSITTQVTAGGTTHTRTIDDGRGLTDALSVVVSHARTIDDSRGLADSVALTASYQRTFDDSRGLTDTADTQAAGFATRSLDDSRGLTDALAASASFARSADDGRGLTDSMATVASYAPVVDDSRGLTDALAPAVTYVRTLGDDRGLTDGMFTGSGTLISLTFGDDRGLSGEIQAVRTTRRPSDGVTARPSTGTTTRPSAGVTHRHPFVPA